MERLSRALVDLCYERELAEITIADVCEKAGAEPAEFDARYDNVADCFTQAYEEMADEFIARVTSAFDAEQGWRNQLRAAAYATLLHLEEDPARAHFVVVAALNAGEKAQLVRERVFATLIDLVDRGRHEPGASPTVTRATAESLNGAVFRHMRITIERGQEHRYAEVVPELMHAVVLQYLGPEQAEEELTIRPPALAGG
jgi:AcrR family transcriptional regulator